MRNSLEKILLLIACSPGVFSSGASAAPLTEEYRDGVLQAVSEVSGTEITTAGRVRLSLEARAPAGYRLKLPEERRTMGAFRIREARYTGPEISGDGTSVLKRAEWLLEPNLPGAYEIPALPVSCTPIQGGGGAPASIETRPITVGVESVFPEGLESVTLKALVPPPTEHRSWLPILLVLVVLPPAISMFLQFVAAGSAVSRNGALQPATTPADSAFRELRSVRAGGGDEFVADRIREICAEYLQGRFRLRTRGASAEDLIGALGGAVNESARGTFVRLVDQLDKARFGREENAGGATLRAMKLLEDFIAETSWTGKEEQAT